VSKKRTTPEDAFDIKRLSDCLDIASSTNPTHEADGAGRDTRSILKDFLRQTDRDLATMSSRNRSEDERLEATKRLLSCYRLVHSGASKSQKERDRRLAVLAEIEAEAGFKNLQVRLRLLLDGLAHEVFLSTDPVQALDHILHGKVRRGAPKKEERRNIEIAAAVLDRMRRGMTAEAAYVDVSNDETKNREPIGPDGVRRICEKLTRERGRLPPIVFVEASCISERAKAKTTS
jgi:hypothetical protein